MTLNKTQAGMKKGETFTLKAVVAPEKATNKVIKWSSSNTKIAAVDKNGKVKALQNGTATIKATAKDGSGVSASCKITVGYKITYKLGKGKNNDQNPEYYYNQKVNLKAASKKGYAFKGWYTDSKYTKKITTIAKNSKKNITVYAKWEKVVVKKGAVKKVTVTGTSKTLSKLSKGKNYYVKVRAYKKDSTGAKVYGSFSSVKKVKISK
ncbi:Ig-like domain-containing protein [Roseburia intestinalis]